MNKDIIILKLLLGWEIIHISKNGKKVSIRLREFPGKGSRFIRATFSMCDIAVFIELENGQLEDFSKIRIRDAILYKVHKEIDGIISIHILKGNNIFGILKIHAMEIKFDFTTK
ncbi:hypothetical protein JW766_01550 [Candidatus Dojkabacteria bacterium]|nr:hypothetical protein [Candidatus Dojkabacteria bacterium]